ncbi:hypothetical protein [Kaistella rhinocerotis]|uniref:hypothetical protein n=1 Tax=Kaistella rhinocerotis TaxID=3026437 RepID=UPI002554F153|nr:hypothetical protein [Kaistella sp. Ran72]
MIKSVVNIANKNCHIIGKINVVLATYAEVEILAPYCGFRFRSSISTTENEAKEQSDAFAETLLNEAYLICDTIQTNREAMKTDFLRLLETLEKFNNRKTEDYIRNKDELLKVFMKSFFSGTDYSPKKSSEVAEAIFEFLALYFIRHGKSAELDVRTRFAEHPRTPSFNELQPLLKIYLEKSIDDRIELLSEQILTQKTGTFDWFIQQEFFEQ